MNKPTNSNLESKQNKLPYEHCLNCGTELQGMYCHVCGQEATSKTPTVGEYIVEYFNNAFIWDTKFVKTIWTLISRPGHLTNEYIQGKFASQEHPLKLNMFLLFVFISIFVLFTDSDIINNSMEELTTDEKVLPGIQMEFILTQEEYAKKFQEAPRDTVQLIAPLQLAERYSGYIINLETIEDAQDEGLDKWVAVIPHMLIENEIVIPDSSGYYRFSQKTKIGKQDLNFIFALWKKLVDIISTYFPMLALLTAPILSMALGVVQRKSRLPRIHHFIFALHYTAFLEFLMICLYITHLVASPSIDMLNNVMIAGSCLYLTIAFRNVYKTKTWFRAILKAVFTSLTFLIIGLVILFGIFIVACCFIAVDMFNVM